MPRLSKKDKEEWSFFISDNGRRTYNEKCRKCTGECKQSFRAQIVYCPIYKSKRAGD